MATWVWFGAFANLYKTVGFPGELPSAHFPFQPPRHDLLSGVGYLNLAQRDCCINAQA
jgi:hypothetical protein